MMIGFDRVDNLTDVGCGVRYLESAIRASALPPQDGQMMANWIIHELLGLLSKAGLRFIECPVCPQEFGKLVRNVKEGALPRPIARDMLSQSIQDPGFSISQHLVQFIPEDSKTTKTGRLMSELSLEKLTDDIVLDLAKEVRLIQNGHINIIGKLVGEGMRRSQKVADPRLLRKVLEHKILGSGSKDLDGSDRK